MKKLTTIVFLFWSFAMMSQNYFGVAGTVTDEADGSPVPGQEMNVSFLNPVDSTLLFNTSIFTNDAGYYEFEEDFNLEIVLALVGTTDCNNTPVYEYGLLTVQNPWLESDFSICSGNYGDCEAYFEYSMGENDLTVEFENLSSGDNLSYFWSFGDDTYSEEENPVHTYETAGEYYVVLIIANGDSTCVEDYQEWIYVGGGQGECEAYFEYSMGENDLTVEFENLSSGDDLSYFWSFGDDTYSEEENPVHTYQYEGEYYVTLIIANGDSTCVEDYQEWIYVGGGQGDCEAYFEYSMGENDLTVEFENLSSGEDLSYFWSFGDDTYSEEENPVHTYQYEGEYYVTLIIANGDSTCVEDYQEWIYVGGGQGDCEAYFEYSMGENDLTVEFENLSSGDNLSYFWSFGDDTYSEEDNPVHTYETAGEYYVVLIIANGDSTCVEDYQEWIYVGGGQGECEAYFEYEQEDAYTFAFFNESEGEDLIYYWSFGDNTYSEEENPVHTYGNDGFYWVTLMITNADSTCFDYYEDMVIAGDSIPGDCNAYFEYYLTDDGYRVEFENLSEGDDLSFYWDFGDGNFSQEENPEHTYEEPGIYQVCLIASSSDSTCVDLFCEPIVIEDADACIAQFAYYPDSDEVYTYQFVDLSYGNIESWYWDFGDGTYSDDQNPLHAFTEEGYYYVCLTIECTGEDGNKGTDCTSTWCEEVYVGEYEDCFNFFTYQNVDNTVLFEGFHSSDWEAWYTWEFGDGATGEGQITEHTYETTGTYFVTLTSVDEDSCVATSSQVIVVGDSIEYNQVYGQIFEGDFPMEEGVAMIFSTDPGENYDPFFDITFVDSAGVYVFPYVPNGEFYVYAVPFNWNGFLPTYYGDVLNWDEATPIILGEPENPYDIHLVNADGASGTGNGLITGIISNGVREEFVDKINMLLYDESYNVIGFTNVNEEGRFNLDNLANGTYYIYPELSGVSSSFTRVDITDEQQEVIVNMTLDGSTILGIDNASIVTEAGQIFPNPAGDLARLELHNQKATEVTVSVRDITGRTQSVNTYKLEAERTLIDIPMKHLEAGIYFVRITNTEGDVITRKIAHQ